MIGFEYLPRPYPYGREPFLVASGEKVGFEGRFFSIPAFAAQADKRLFTVSASHPVANVFKLYVNRGSNTTISLEPTINASGYERGTPHYADVILDIRDVLQSAWAGHALDSDHTAHDFRVCHLERQHEPYNLETSSRPDVIPGDYVHQESITLTPSGNELGAKTILDIDVDEVQWQPFARPKNLGTITGMPFEPCFPMVLKSNGSLPDMSSFDEEKFSELGLGGSVSGGLVITGDGLLQGTTIKLLDGSGASFVGQGTFREMVPWALYPALNQLNLYYTTQNSGTITASGRQAIYNTPTPPDSEGVFLLNVSDAGTSGKLIQNWPGNYYATSGIDVNGKAHNGVHVVDRLIYNLYGAAAGGLHHGRSILNGKKVFAHFVGTETNERGKSYNTSAVRYSNGNTVYGFGGILNPLTGSAPDFSSEVSWFSSNKTFSPLSWTSFLTTVYQPSVGIFGAPNSTNFTLGDINASTARIITRKLYAQWGYIDQVVAPDIDRAELGVKVRETVFFETHVFRETAIGGWEELPPPQSPIFTTQNIVFYRNTYSVNNIFSFFFLRKPNYGFVHVNGNIAVQWGEIAAGIAVKPVANRFSTIGATSTKLVPATAHSVRIVTIGFFPNWARRLYVTTNNQVEVPDQISISSASTSISFDPSVPMTTSRVDTFGPAIWDPDEGVNYIYFNTIDATPRFYFARMNTSFVITQINQVDSTDAILSGRAAILGI